MKQHYPLDPVTGIENPALAWANGNPATGTNGSYPPYGLFLDPQKEILAAQRAGGLTDSVDGSDTAQLAQAISRGTWLGTLGQPATANDLTAALPGSIIWPLLLIGMEFGGIINAVNTGAMTVALTGFGTLPGKLNLVGKGGGALAAGDVPANVPFKFKFDGTQYRLSSAAASEQAASLTTVIQNTYAKGSLIATREFDLTNSAASFTYTPTPGTRYVDVEVIGGGGAGTGAGAPGSNNYIVSPGGGGAGVARAIIASGFSGVTCTLGAGGVGQTSNSGGASGGTTSFGTKLTATGGSGGTPVASVTNGTSVTQAGGSGGLGSSNLAAGDTLLLIGQGQQGGNSTGTSTNNLAAGYGGGSNGLFGPAGIFTPNTGPDAASAGCGGGGAAQGNGNPGIRGGNGAGGRITIREIA